MVGTFVATSAATVRVAKTPLFKTSKTIPPVMIPIIAFKWMEPPVSFHIEIAKTSEAVAMRTQVQDASGRAQLTKQTWRHILQSRETSRIVAGVLGTGRLR